MAKRKAKTCSKRTNKKRNVESIASSNPRIIPPEIIMEILSWLPAEVVTRLKCVCKKWHAMIQDHHFIRKHMSRALNDITQYKWIAKPDPASPRFICGCDGLWLSIKIASFKFHIENQTTRQILELPDPSKRSFFFSFLFIPSTRVYKLVSIFDIDGRKAGNEGCQVLTVGTDDSWRLLQVPSLHDVDNKRDIPSVVVAAGSTVHCIRLSKGGSNIYEEVVSIDVETECFTATALSRDLLPNWTKARASTWNGKLSFASIVQEAMHVVVLEDHKRQKWGAKFVISLAFLKGNGYALIDFLPLFAQDGKLWFRWKEEKYIGYNMDSWTIYHTITAYQGCKMLPRSFNLRPRSLVTLKGMQPQMKQPSQNQV